MAASLETGQIDPLDLALSGCAHARKAKREAQAPLQHWTMGGPAPSKTVASAISQAGGQVPERPDPSDRAHAMTMDTSFRLLMVIAGAFALAAADHYLLGGRIAAAMPRLF